MAHERYKRLSPEEHARRRERTRQWEAKAWRDPVWREKLRAKNREQYLKVRNDPERWAQRRADQRMAKRLKREREGAPRPPVRPETYARRYGSGYGNGAELPADPLRSIVERAIEELGNKAVLARLSGVPERRLYALVNGESQNVSLPVADKLCVALQIPLSLVYQEAV